MNAPVAWVKTGARGVGVIPTDQVRVTGALVGKPSPVAIVTKPGGPSVGSTRRSPTPTAAMSWTTSDGPASDATESCAVRVPVAVR